MAGRARKAKADERPLTAAELAVAARAERERRRNLPPNAAELKALRAERDWRRAAAALTFGEPDPSLARAHLLEFVRWATPGYLAGWFHRELCAELERFSRDVTAGRSPRLLIAAPPRHGKSAVVSRAWPIWHLGHNPTHEVVLASYGQDLANEMSGDARAIRARVVDEMSAWAHLRPKPFGKNGVERWQIEGGGQYKAVGVGGPLTGSGAHILAIDDPFKNDEEADSASIRESRWSWYTSTAYTRLAPGGGILVMATRWHHNDVTGRALDQLAAGEEPWRVMSFPAIAEQDEPFRRAGEALHPERYPVEDLERKRVVLGSRQFSALYQQRPTPDVGGLFKRDWFTHRFAHDPQRPPLGYYDETVVSVDATFKDGVGTDYVVMQAWSTHRPPRQQGEAAAHARVEHHLRGQLRARMSYVETKQALRDFCTMWRPDVVLIEEKANGAALISDLRDEIRNVIPFVPDRHGNKVTRANHAAPYWESGAVRLPAVAPFVGDLVEEHASFPLGANDDQVDAGTQYLLWQRDRTSDRIDHAAAARASRMLLERLGRR